MWRVCISYVSEYVQNRCFLDVFPVDSSLVTTYIDLSSIYQLSGLDEHATIAYDQYILLEI